MRLLPPSQLDTLSQAKLKRDFQRLQLAESQKHSSVCCTASAQNKNSVTLIGHAVWLIKNRDLSLAILGNSEGGSS